MNKMKSLSDLKSDPRIDSISDERGYGEGIWVYANDRNGYFIEGGSEAGGSYVQIHEDTLRDVLKQANRIKHISEFSEDEKRNLREWAAANKYRIKENPIKKNTIEKGFGMKEQEKVARHVAFFTTQRILGRKGVSGEFLDGMAVGLKSAGYPELADPLGDWESASPEELSRIINRWAGERIFKSDLTLENPLKPRKGESVRDFTSRCMSEEKASFPKTKQRIAVCLSKSRKHNPVYDTGSDE